MTRSMHGELSVFNAMFHTGYSPAVANFERGPILGEKGTHHHDEEKDLVGW